MSRRFLGRLRGVGARRPPKRPRSDGTPPPGAAHAGKALVAAPLPLPPKRPVPRGPGFESYDVVLLRHGQSKWNATKRFSGWVDVGLSDKGKDEAVRAGETLRRQGFEFDEAHTSRLKRAICTMWGVAHGGEFEYINCNKTYRLNERHYGALTGLPKTLAGEVFGDEALADYRRGFDTVPPKMSKEHAFFEPVHGDGRYDDVPHGDVPRGESLAMCAERVLPYWEDTIVPSVLSGNRIIVCAHNNVIRCLVHHIDGLTEDSLEKLEIPTGAPLLYRFDANMQSVGTARADGFSGTFLEEGQASDCASKEDVLREAETVCDTLLRARDEEVMRPFAAAGGGGQ